MLERSAFLLHDVAPAGAAGPSIDHVAVGTSGVWVIASRPIALKRVRIHRPLFGPSTLRVGGDDHTALLDLLDRQRTLLCGALADLPHVPLHTALSFTGGQFPLLGTLTLGGHVILRPTELAKRVAARGPLRRSESREVAGLLHERLAG